MLLKKIENVKIVTKTFFFSAQFYEVSIGDFIGIVTEIAENLENILTDDDSPSLK